MTAQKYDKLKVMVSIKGSPVRPFYSGAVEVVMYQDDYTKGDVRQAVYKKLRATSFPDIWADSVVVHSWEVI